MLILGSLVLGPSGAVAAANGQVCMGVVVDDGGYKGNGTAVQAANVGAGSSDLQALQALGDTAYQNDAGLVCAIDDGNGAGQVPSNGVQNCLATSGNDYFYWAYWEGDPYTNTWTYASIGPAEHTVSSGQTYVEGWSYQNPGADNANAKKPSVSPGAAFAQACPGVTPVNSQSSGGSSSGGGGNGSGGGGGVSPVGSPSPGAAGPSATTTTAAAATGSPAPRTAGSGITGSGTNTTTTSHPSAVASPAPAASHGTSTTTTTTANGAHHDDGTALAVSRGHGGSGGADPALPIVIVAAVILALGGLAWWRWRRRPLEE